MVHGDAGVNFNVATPRRHTYGLVEWEVEFDLVVLVETGDGTGNQGDENDTSQPTSGDRLGRQALERRPTCDPGGRQTFEGDAEDARGAGGDSGASLSVYHFPDLCGQGTSDGGGGKKKWAYGGGHSKELRGYQPCFVAEAFEGLRGFRRYSVSEAFSFGFQRNFWSSPCFCSSELPSAEAGTWSLAAALLHIRAALLLRCFLSCSVHLQGTASKFH